MKSFPKIIPIFPLSGVIYFPKTNLPLNIFEQRYLDLVNDAYNKDKLMGMVQLHRKNNSVYKVGCLGKISELQKSDDGRILINLTGLTRFEILEEIKNNKLYREFKVNYENYETDLKEAYSGNKNNELMKKIKIFYEKNGLLLNWKEFERLDENQKINTLAMISPISNEEKQKLIESISMQEKVNTLDQIVSFYLHDTEIKNKTIQ